MLAGEAPGPRSSAAGVNAARPAARIPIARRVPRSSGIEQRVHPGAQGLSLGPKPHDVFQVHQHDPICRQHAQIISASACASSCPDWVSGLWAVSGGRRSDSARRSDTSRACPPRSSTAHRPAWCRARTRDGRPARRRSRRFQAAACSAHVAFFVLRLCTTIKGRMDVWLLVQPSVVAAGGGISTAAFTRSGDESPGFVGGSC